MVRWFGGALTALGVVACSGEEGPPPVFNDPPTAETGEAPIGPLRETRLRVGAFFRYDAATRVPGPWIDESSGDSTSAIQFIVGDDEYDGSNGTFCEVLVPIRGEGARQDLDLEDRQFWAADLVVDPEDIVTNCDEPEHERIWDFYDGRLVEFLTTNRDGSPPTWGVVVEEPSATAVDWASSSGIEVERIIGGEVRVSNQWVGSRVDAIVTIGFETDASGTLIVDETGDNVPILLTEIRTGPIDIQDGYYRMIGYQYQVVTASVVP